MSQIKPSKKTPRSQIVEDHGMEDKDVRNKYITPCVTYEVSGYISPVTFKCYVTNMGRIHEEKQRSTVLMDINKILFHTHPYNNGYWPSLEDLQNIRKPSIQVIYSRFGHWVYHSRSDMNFNKINHIIEQIWKEMHAYLMKHVNVIYDNSINKDIIDNIDYFCKRLRNYMFIEFYPILSGLDRSMEYVLKITKGLPSHITNDNVKKYKSMMNNMSVMKILSRR